MYNVGSCGASAVVATPATQPNGGKPFCASWDASYNLDGEFGKTNGQFGFRATVKTNQTTVTSGNINIEQTAAYPGQNQFPIQVDVTNIHSVRSSPTVVGQVTGVAAQPYNIQYRLSKDSNARVTIVDSSATATIYRYATADSEGNDSAVSNKICNLHTTPTKEEYDAAGYSVSNGIGEGTPDGSLANGVPWDGRDMCGQMLPAGNYLVRIDAKSDDDFTTVPGGGTDIALSLTRQISLDPLQITDIKLKALGSLTTDVAVITYMLTESATVYVRILKPGTIVPVNTVPYTATTCAADSSCLREFVEQKEFRKSVFTMWDGRDKDGNVLDDNDYTYVIWAEMPTATPFFATTKIYTSKNYTGIISVNRGSVLTGPPVPSSAMVGSSPTVAGLNPFQFRYSLARDCPVTLKVKTPSNVQVRVLVSSDTRYSSIVNTERWDGIDDNGRYISSGTYLLELTGIDPLFPNDTDKQMRTTALFPVNMFRITDVGSTPLLGDSSGQATLTYMLTQTMNVDVRIYPPGTIINVNGNWPPVQGVDVTTAPVKTFSGVRPGRYKVTEYWDGVDTVANTMYADGEYPFIVVAKSTAPSSTYSATNTSVGIATVTYATDRVVGKLAVSRGPVYLNSVNLIPTIPTLTASSETVKLPPYQIEFQVTRLSSVTIQVINANKCTGSDFPNNICKTVVSGQIYDPGQVNRVFWDGTDTKGQYVLPDAYTIRLTAYNYPTESLQPATTYQTSLDVSPFQVFDLNMMDISAAQPNGAINYQLSLPMKVGIQIFKPGTTFDSNGNPTPSIANGSLVKAIVGVRPPGSPISETWDGTDRAFAAVPDGTYPFRIVNSTDSRLVDSITGEIASGNKSYNSDLNAFLTVNTLTVSRGDSTDPCTDFKGTTSFYPNPLTTVNGKFRITKIPTPGYYSIKLFNVAGDLVYENDLGYQVPSSTYPNIEIVWDRSNGKGNKVARGVYFAVMRLQASQGAKQTCQTVKKILIP